MKTFVLFLIFALACCQLHKEYLDSVGSASISKFDPNKHFIEVIASPHHRAIYHFNLNITTRFHYLECNNNWLDIKLAKFVVPLLEIKTTKAKLLVSTGGFDINTVTWNCPFDECYSYFGGGNFEKITSKMIIHSQVIEFDVTPILKKRINKNTNIYFALETSNEIYLNNTAKIIIENYEVPVTTILPEKFIVVHNATIAYYDEGPINDDIVFLLIHGIPLFKYMFRNIIPNLSQRHRTIALDLIGIGHSSRLLPSKFNYSHISQAKYIEEFARKLGILNKKIILLVDEVGGLSGNYFASKNIKSIHGIIFIETWLNTCPIEANGIYCEQTSLIPSHYWDFWDTVYFNLTSGQCPPSYVSPIGFTTLVNMSQEVQAIYKELWKIDDCNTSFSLHAFPINVITHPSRKEPTEMRAAYNYYHQIFETSQIKKLYIFSDPGSYVSYVGQPAEFLRKYPNSIAKCVATNYRYPTEFSPYTVSRIILETFND